MPKNEQISEHGKELKEIIKEEAVKSHKEEENCCLPADVRHDSIYNK